MGLLGFNGITQGLRMREQASAEFLPVQREPIPFGASLARAGYTAWIVPTGDGKEEIRSIYTSEYYSYKEDEKTWRSIRMIQTVLGIAALLMNLLAVFFVISQQAAHILRVIMAAVLIADCYWLLLLIQHGKAPYYMTIGVHNIAVIRYRKGLGIMATITFLSSMVELIVYRLLAIEGGSALITLIISCVALFIYIFLLVFERRRRILVIENPVQLPEGARPADK